MYEQKDNPDKKDSQDESTRKAMRENIMRMALTSEARQRLANVRMVKPQIAQTIEEYIIQTGLIGQAQAGSSTTIMLKSILADVPGEEKRVHN